MKVLGILLILCAVGGMVAMGIRMSQNSMASAEQRQRDTSMLIAPIGGLVLGFWLLKK